MIVGEIDPEKARFPLCITWTPLPCITWFIPCIGHTGICDTEGVIHDFAGPFCVSYDDFAFGKTYKYVRLNIDKESYAKYNADIKKANNRYMKRMHNICCDNCHSHVANVLNNFKYQGRENWTMIGVWWLLITRGRYVSCWTLLRTYFGFLVILSIIATIVTLTKVY